VCLLVITTDDAVARWAARAIDLGGGNRFTPLVLGPSGTPVVENRAQARADPALAVLSAMAHGRDHVTGPRKSMRSRNSVIRAAAGIHDCCGILGPRVREGDGRLSGS